MVEGFDIRFVDDEGAPEKTRFGEILIGSFRERFLSDMTFWTEAEYEGQWRDAVSQVVTLDKAALITSITEPSTTNFIRWWAMYRDGETVVFNDQVFFLSEAKEPFAAHATGRFVPERETVSETGQPISEWSTTTAALRAFRQSIEVR
jgi:contact-dependent growth inhibition (CDI) system CdiI-like immunity protein